VLRKQIAALDELLASRDRLNERIGLGSSNNTDKEAEEDGIEERHTSQIAAPQPAIF
jgi:hypothetical protein